jgi:hypothetical protein
MKANPTPPVIHLKDRFETFIFFHPTKKTWDLVAEVTPKTQAHDIRFKLLAVTTAGKLAMN